MGVTEGLTASTRKSDVFPAFCRPIMVISISVALSASYICQHYSRQHDHTTFQPLLLQVDKTLIDALLHAARAGHYMKTYQNNLKSQS